MGYRDLIIPCLLFSLLVFDNQVSCLRVSVLARSPTLPGSLERNNWWQDWWDQYIARINDPTIKPFLTSASSLSASSLLGDPSNVVVFDNTNSDISADVSNFMINFLL